MVEKTQKDPAQQADSAQKEQAQKVEARKNQPEKRQEKKKNSFFRFLGALIVLAVCIGAAVYCVPSLRGKAAALYEEKIAPKIASFTLKKNAEPVVVEEITAVVEPVADAQEAAAAEIEAEPMPAVVEEIQEIQEIPAPEPVKENEKTQAMLEQALERNAVLEMKLARLEAQKADASEVMILAKRLAETEKKANAAAVRKERDAVALLALAQLQQAALAGKPFAVEQRALTRLTQDSSVLAEKIALLTPFADTGVAPYARLQDSFDAYARKVISRDKTAAGDGWLTKSLASLKSLIVIRRTDVSENATDIDGILARAEKSVKDGDLKSAVAVLKNMNNDDISVMMPWIVSAERTLIVQQTVNEAVAILLSDKYAN